MSIPLAYLLAYFLERRGDMDGRQMFFTSEILKQLTRIADALEKPVNKTTDLKLDSSAICSAIDGTSQVNQEKYDKN